MESNSTPAPKRRRGRPRKHPLPTAAPTAEAIANRVVAASPNIDDLDKLAEAITHRLRMTIDAASARLPVTEILLVNTRQVAEMLSISEGTVLNLISSGQLQSVHIRGSLRVALDEVRRLASTGTNLTAKPQLT